MSQLMLPRQWLKLRRVKNDFFEKFFLLILTSQMKSTGINWLPYQFSCVPSTNCRGTVFQSWVLSTKTLKFHEYDVIIYDVSIDFVILLGKRNDLVISYPCAKFQKDMTIKNGISCIYHVFFVCIFGQTREVSV